MPPPDPPRRLLEPLEIGPRVAPNRLLFGPHPTNLGRDRRFSERHVAYYARRARGGCGVIVVEEASVHPSDWPYERAPLAADAGEGWAAVAAACREAPGDPPLLIAALGHSGGQGSSAYSQGALWAPTDVPDPATREVPKEMEDEDIRALLEGFTHAAAAAATAGLDGVEINAGQHSLLRQFLSGLTNHRSDPYGTDRVLLVRRALEAVHRGLCLGSGDDPAAARSSNRVVGLRLSCDELAPWAGVVPDDGARIAADLAAGGLVDYLVVVRGSLYDTAATRPDGHANEGFNLDLVANVRRHLGSSGANTRLVGQGSIVDAEMAEAFLADGVCDLVEMTRAQIAEPDLGLLLGDPRGRRPRPCILCNERCQVRDPRNPFVGCVGEPEAGHETDLGAHAKGPGSPDASAAPRGPRGGRPAQLLVVGGGPAGLECARVAAGGGLEVTLAERHPVLGGALTVAATALGRSRLGDLVAWLADECRRLGVRIETSRDLTAADLEHHVGLVALCTGSVAGELPCPVDDDAAVVSAVDALGDHPSIPPGARVLVWDPVGGPVGVSVAETRRGAGDDVALVTPDPICGQRLSASGDLVAANTRLQRADVRIVRNALLHHVGSGCATVVGRFAGTSERIDADVVVDAGHRLPDERLWLETGSRFPRAGDALAPRGIGDAVLEGRRLATTLLAAAAMPDGYSTTEGLR